MAGILGVDAYTLTARIAPALAAAAPLAIAGAVAVPEAGPVATAAIVAATTGGIAVFVSQLVRSAGRRAEQELASSWGGMPSISALRPAPDPRVMHRRTQLEILYPDVHLSGPIDAANDPSEADRRASVAVERLRADTRDQARFYLLHEENRHYGFRRNVYGIRNMARAGAVLGLGASIALLLWRGISVPGLMWATVQTVLLAVWTLVPSPTWVRDAADRYTDQLFQALDVLVDARRREEGGSASRIIRA